MKQIVRQTLIVYSVFGAVFAGLWFANPDFFWPVKAALTGRGDFQFLYPWALLVAALVGPVYLTARARPKRDKVAVMTFTRGDFLAGAPKTLRQRLRWLPDVLRALAIAALCIGLARPQVAETETVEADGIDIYLVLDMSGSMQAVDMSASEVRYLETQGLVPMNRFEIAQQVLSGFVGRRRDQPWTDRLGMVIFAEQAFLQFPLTVDYPTILWLLERLRLNDIVASQTAIGNALGLAVSGLVESEAESKVLILLTDGDERGGNISAEAVASVAADQGIVIYPILVGQEGPALVPAGRNRFTQRWEVVEHPVDVELLERVASETGGQFFRAENRDELETTLEDIITAYDRTTFEEEIEPERNEVYPPFLWFALALLGFDLLMRFTFIRKFP